MVSDVTTLCMRVMRLQGAQVQQLMTADYEMCASPSLLASSRLWCSSLLLTSLSCPGLSCR